MGAAVAQLKVSVFSDYICPFCYIGSRRLLRLGDEFDLRVNWCGLEIHPDTPAEGMPVERLGYAAGQWNDMMDGLRRMAAEEHIDLPERSFTTNSHKALLLAEAAKTTGREAFYRLHEGLFRAYFTDGLNIGDPAVLRDLAAKSGLPAPLMESAWSDDRYEQRLQLNLRHAAELGVRGTPTYVFGHELVVGAVPLEQLRSTARRHCETN